MSAVMVHVAMTKNFERPCSLISTEPESASGKFEAKMAMRRVSTLVPDKSDTPSAMFSGTAVEGDGGEDGETGDSTSGAFDVFVEERVGDDEDPRPGEHPDAGENHAPAFERLLDEVEGEGADESAARERESERHELPRRIEQSPTTPPITSAVRIGEPAMVSSAFFFRHPTFPHHKKRLDPSGVHAHSGGYFICRHARIAHTLDFFFEADCASLLVQNKLLAVSRLGHGFARSENRLEFYAAAEEFLAKRPGGRAM